jgi:hypothetical protein
MDQLHCIAREAEEADADRIIAATPSLTVERLQSLRANADLHPPTRDLHVILARLIKDDWHQVFVVEDGQRLTAWVVVVLQRERSVFGDHVRVQQIFGSSGERTIIPLAAEIGRLAKEFELRAVDIDAAMPERDVELFRAHLPGNVRLFHRRQPVG